MNIQLRLEQPQDYRIVEELTREAFWGMNHPDCNEHLLAHKLRSVSAFVPELDYVAVISDIIVGNVMFSKGRIVDAQGREYIVLNFGPLSVLPEYQNRGVGKALMTYTISEAKRLGYRAILFFGHPDYYTRFGFKRAKEFSITTSGGVNFDAFMAMPLYDGALDGIAGRYYEDPVFEIGEDEKVEFDKGFPYKEKCVLVSAEVLFTKLISTACAALKKHEIAFLCDLRRYSEQEVSSWNGIDKISLEIIKATMMENGFVWGEQTHS
ncbi:MAG: GNAT family N-acetyltransferase [Sedimentibacter sp.]|uniref:GNAT family N-acetyltransferase n=1 Tax=Sedimentibacter sp. TaxID=1960295 RepID=UPI003158B16E